MAYRRTKGAAERLKRKLENMRRGSERARMARPAPLRAPDLPLLRRRVTVEDFDGETPSVRVFDLERSRRVDSYNIRVDGEPWKRMGWARFCDRLRAAYVRLPSARSDFWQGHE